MFAHPRGKEFVDFDEDLTLVDLRTAVREGFDSVELMKRYTTIGMGPSQGKLSNVNGIRVLAELTGRDIDAVGATTPRPFVHPVPMAALAGRRLRRAWRTPLDAWHRAHGGIMQEAGTWLRPRCYAATSGQAARAAAVAREHAAVRSAVGLIDVSTLGKIEIFGPDAVALLEYAYPCSFARLAQGMTRYVFMTDGSGTLIDDGVCACLGAQHYYLTTTSGQSQNVVRLLELYAAELALDVAIVERSFALGAINLAGPAARAVLAALSDIDLAAQAFPYLACREGAVAGVPARVMRVGFVGELGYEIHLPASRTCAVWEALMEVGSAHGIAPFGVDTQRLLRLEKGHVIVGHDTDGTTNPFEVGLGRAVTKSKSRHVGRHALGVLGTRVTRRLAGFVARDGRAGDIAECLLVIEDGRIAGRVTSVGASPVVGAVVGLVMVEEALAEPGRRLHVRLVDGTLLAIEVTATPFYDPHNARQDAGHDVAASTAPALQVSAESPVCEAYPTADFTTVVLNGTRLARRRGARPAARAWLLDLAHLPLRLVVGGGASAWFAARELAVPQAIQSARLLGTDGLVARTHVDEFLVVGASRAGAADALARATPGRDSDVLVLAEERAHFALVGAAWATILAEL
ncbi:MAG: glycine cleavage T C-terminal barrel domain-containing protein, partial [Gammaproteobacteria bacterium]